MPTNPRTRRPEELMILLVCSRLYLRWLAISTSLNPLALIETIKISRSISDRVDYPPIRLSCFGIISVSVRQFSPVSFLP